ncbi:MAG: alpha/beta fold hydrolase [Rhodospirillaceae bacterium]
MSTATAADLIPHALIRRDTFGVPHITADTDEAAAFAMGYAVAEDHAVEMGKLYLLARGDGARWFGPQYLDNDFAQKRMGNLEGARRALEEQTGDGYRRWLHGFVTGVNFYAGQHRAELPEWFPTVTEADIIAFSHEGAAASAVRPPPRAGGGEGLAATDNQPGSNAIAIGGSRSTTGAPILLANPHLRWSAQYWEAQITVPGTFNFYGSLTVGLAVLRAGFNDTIGYAQTNNNVDVIDHYAVPLDPANPDQYVFAGKSQPFQHQTVRVDVLQPTGQVETVEREFRATTFGPVVGKSATQVIVSRSAGLDAWRFHEGYYDLYFARDLDSFMATLSRQLIPSSNFTYADANGNIQYLWNSALPRRPEGDVNYAGVVPGNDDRYFFKGTVPLAEVPRFLNPASGYVMNSNNPPWFATVRERLNPSKFPPYMEQGEPGLRPQMALHLLEARAKFSPEDLRKLKFTLHSLLSDRVLPDLLAAGAKVKAPSADLRAGLRILKSWDREVAAKSRGGVLFTAFWDSYEKSTKPAFREAWDNDRVIDTPTGLADPRAALAALEEAVAVVREKYGAPDVAWGDVNRFQFPGIDLPGDGASGGYGLYKVQTFDPVEGAPKHIAGRFNDAGPIAGFGDGWILMTSFTQPVSAQGVLAYGQSSNADSPHARDQIKLFANHQLRPIWFTDAEIKANTEREYRPGAATDELMRRDTFVDSDGGVRLFVRAVTGKDTSGTPILLVHDAAAGGLVSFDLPGASVAADFARAGHPVTIMSVRGWEKSTRPSALDQPAEANKPAVSLDEAARDIDAVVTAIRAERGQVKVALLGWGAGGLWAGAYASRHPNDLSHLVLLNPGVDAASCGAVPGAYQVADARALRKRWDAALPRKNPGAWRDEAVAATFVQRALRLDPSSDARTPASVRIPTGPVAEACGGKPLWDAARVTMPTLVARGEKDDSAMPADVAALKAKAVTIKGGTHYLLLDKPEHGRKQFMDEALAFLKAGK